MVNKSERVGYKRPPTATQFKPGSSGNPRGRPKNSRNLRTDLAAELSQKIRVREGGREYEVSKQRALLKAVVAAGVKGDVRAATAVINLCARLFGVGPASDDEAEVMTSGDEALLEDFIRREIAKRGAVVSKEFPDDQS
jgi:hypothetical protein